MKLKKSTNQDIDFLNLASELDIDLHNRYGTCTFTRTRKLGYAKAILETGKGQPEAIALYKKCHYFVIENYGVYKNLSNSICMSKLLV